MRMLAVAVLSSVTFELGVAADTLLPFRLRGAGDIVVPVTVEGQGPFNFVLDTGSSRSAISERMAVRLNAGQLAETVMLTPSGRARRGLVQVRDVRVGPVARTALIVMTLPDRDLGHGIDGLIGQDVLASLIYTIDYDRRRLLWHANDSSLGRGQRLTLEWGEGRFLVALPQRSGPCAVLRVVPDSGADGLVVFARPGHPVPRMTLLDVGMLATLSGDRLARSIVLDDLDVGDVRLRDQRALLIDDANGGASFGDGLLPLHLFSTVTFNGPQRYLIVDRARVP